MAISLASGKKILTAKTQKRKGNAKEHLVASELFFAFPSRLRVFAVGVDVGVLNPP
jgi:hypothetical protein